MANINHLITLGIGTPADIPHFLLVGLSTGAVVAANPSVLTLVGRYQPTLNALGTHVPTLNIVGRFED